MLFCTSMFHFGYPRGAGVPPVELHGLEAHATSLTATQLRKKALSRGCRLLCRFIKLGRRKNHGQRLQLAVEWVEEQAERFEGVRAQ